ALPRKMIDQIETALALVHRGTPPTVLYAGNHSLRQLVKQRFDPLTTVFIAKNVRPAADKEQVFPAQIELAFVYDDYRTKSPGGFSEVGRECRALVPTTQGYIGAVRYMSDLPSDGFGPLLIDVGSANSVIAASVNGTPVYTIRTDLGLGHNIVSALDTVTAERVRRWLPFDISNDALNDYVHNKQLRPATIPGTAHDLMIEQALAREIVRTLVADAQPAWNVDDITLLPPFQPIIAAGAARTEAQTPGMSALLLLDALQPTGLVELRLDPHNLISALGVISYVKPLMTVQALEAGGLINLGTAFCPVGRVRAGRRAMTVRIRYGENKQIDHVVRGGEIWMAPLLPGEEVEVRVRLSRGLSINGKRRLKRQMVAGAAGIIFDARGRPLVMPRQKDRVERFGKWQAAMTDREWPPAPSVPTITIPDQVQPLPEPEPLQESTLDMLRSEADTGDDDGGFEW
ncbi:MAG: glutamate mutase L, partial [Anaerolineae bacterium]|nr:glutamate mutase L [Anaerolineae bacterium]